MNKIQILNSSDSKGNYLLTVVKTALMELKVNVPVLKIEEQEIESFGNVLKPALVIDGKVVLAGRVPAISELKELFRKTLTS